MRKRHLNRRTPLVILLLVAALTLMLAGAYQGAKNEATAVTPSLTVYPSITVFPSLTILPRLVASDFSPADGETEVALNRNVTVHFNRDVDTPTLSGNFYIKKFSLMFTLPLAATIFFDHAGYNALLNPADDLLPNSTYIVTLTDDIESTGGLPLFNPQSWSFKTISSPEVVSKTPAAAAVDVPVGQTISVTFDKDMNWGTVNSGTFYLQEATGGLVATAMTHSVDKRTASLVPPAGLKEGTTYVVTLTTAVAAENGLALKEAVSWTFTTAADAPQVTAKVPAHEATGVAVSQTISATFDKDMDAATLTSAGFFVQKSGGTPLSATVAYSAGSRTATLDPAADLEAGATYLVTLSAAVKSAAGKTLAGAPVIWSFTTAAAPVVSFSDVPDSHPYHDAIIDLATRGIIGGYGGGLYGPNDPVRRQQFAKMVVGSLGLPVVESDFPSADVPFTDLGADDLTDLYPHEYVAVCARNGITLGKDATHFDPYSFITRYQVITMVVRAVDNARPGLLVTPPAGYGTWKSDSTHGANAARAEYNGLLNGLSLSALDPYGNMSRGEVAQVLHNLINLLAE